MQKLLLTTQEAADIIGICRTRVYDLLRAGELESIRIGRSRRIPTAALEDFIARLRAQDNDYFDEPQSA